MKKEKKPQTKSAKIVNIVSNCIFIPVMIILFIYFIYSISVITRNGVPSFFGQSYVKVVSHSMTASGIKKGDVVMIKRVKVSEIKVGDVIAFYSCRDFIPDSFGTREQALENDFMTGQKSFPDTPIVLHKVYKIQYDHYGDTWFRTYGTSNIHVGGDPDSEDIAANYRVDKETRGDYVIGVYDEGNILAPILQFISSTTGMIILIIVPSGILLISLLLNIIEIADQMIKEKKQKGVFSEGELKERELDVTTIIEENDDEK